MSRHRRSSSAGRAAARPNPFGHGGQNRQRNIGIVLILLALLAGAAILWFYGSARSTLVELRLTDLCPKETNRPPPAIYAILIDQTDPLAALQQQSVLNAVLAALRSELEGKASENENRHALVEIWTFSNEGKNVTTVGDVRVATERVLSMCNPGGPREWEKLYRNVDVVKRQYDLFYSSLEQTIRRSLSFPEAKQSPVIEAVYAMGVQVFSKPEFVSTRKNLLVVSDLLQNTPNLSMFTGRYRYDAWVATSQGQKALPNLRDVKVDAFVLPAARADLQSADFSNFWFGLLKGSGATTVRLERIR